jgi:hypothetical protein
MLLLVPAAAVAAEKKEIECRRGYVQLNAPGEFKCSRAPMEAGQTSGGFQRFYLNGRTEDGVNVSLRVFRAMSSGAYVRTRSLSQRDDFDLIKSFSRTAKEARGWGAPRQTGATTIAEFESSGGRRCAGFHQRGGTSENGAGYRYEMSGEFCAAKGKPFDAGQAEMLLSRVSVR